MLESITVFDVLDKLNRISCYLESLVINTRRTKSQYVAQQIINRAIKLVRNDYSFSSARTKALKVKFAESKVRRSYGLSNTDEFTVHVELQSVLTNKRKRVILYV